mgnify:CR=1 FL=1
MSARKGRGSMIRDQRRQKERMRNELLGGGEATLGSLSNAARRNMPVVSLPGKGMGEMDQSLRIPRKGK